jgi:hypothetical protein
MKFLNFYGFKNNKILGKHSFLVKISIVAEEYNCIIFKIIHHEQHC